MKKLIVSFLTLLSFIAPLCMSQTSYAATVACYESTGTIAADTAFTTQTKKNLQTGINAKSGSKLAVDGVFGSVSCTALKNYLVSQKAIASTTAKIDIGTITSRLLAVPLVLASDANATVAKNIATPCGNYGTCIYVHKISGKNTLELYNVKSVAISGKTYSHAYVADRTIVNTGMAGVRTRNGEFTIYDERFPNGDGVKISRDDNGNLSTGRMGDPHKFSGGEAFHWRVNYGSAVGSAMKVDTALTYGTHPEYENATYTGGYASHGCVHTPRSFLQKYDATYFVVGTKVKIADQPTV